MSRDSPPGPREGSRRDYSSTVRDLKALIRSEAAEEKRDNLIRDVDALMKELADQREKLVDLKVLAERVDGLTWLVRGVVVTCALEIVVAIVAGLLLKGHA